MRPMGICCARLDRLTLPSIRRRKLNRSPRHAAWHRWLQSESTLYSAIQSQRCRNVSPALVPRVGGLLIGNPSCSGKKSLGGLKKKKRNKSLVNRPR